MDALTSANGVDAFYGQLTEAGLDARTFAACRIGAIGSATAEALVGHGLRPDLVPEEYVAEGLVKALSDQDLKGRRVLLPRAEGARDVLIKKLEAAGAAVDELTLYRAAMPASLPEEALQRLRAGAVDAVTFASSSTVRNLVQLLGGDLSPIEGAAIATIGPITSATARELGLRVDVEAEEHTIAGLVSALADHYAREEAMANA